MQEKNNAPKNRRTNKKPSTSPAQKAVWCANIALIALILLCGFSYLLFFKRDKVSKEENRSLTKFPKFTLSSYFSGEFTEGLADFYDDTIPNRSAFKKIISSKLMPLKGRMYGDDGDGGVELHGAGFEHIQNTTKPAVTVPKETLNTTAPDGSVSEPIVTTELAEQTTSAEEEPVDGDGEVTSNILVINKRGLMLYGGGGGRELDYAQYVSTYKNYFGDALNVYSMVIPTPVSYYMPDEYSGLSAQEKPDIDNISANLTGVTAVDAYGALLAHKDEPIYSRTDHHWQALGAYYAAQEFCKNAGVYFADISQYDEVRLSGYVGTLYGYTQSAQLINNPEDFVYYSPKAEIECENYSTSFDSPYATSLFIDPAYLDTSSYYMVFGSDERIAHVHTQANNGRRLVIFKDSYGNALLPFLTSSFEDIYLCDIRYFDLNALTFISDVGATDLLFAMCTFSAVGPNRTCIYNNMYK
ncbi:MAG: hypothetical protein IJM44_08240 [Ruminococcus sp.]|nr:hypothetical protein [Ruminococcus sp.]